MINFDRRLHSGSQVELNRNIKFQVIYRFWLILSTKIFLFFELRGASKYYYYYFFFYCNFKARHHLSWLVSKAFFGALLISRQCCLDIDNTVHFRIMTLLARGNLRIICWIRNPGSPRGKPVSQSFPSKYCCFT